MYKTICRHGGVFRPEDIEYTARMLSVGGAAILPTSTVYGISCVYNNKDSLKRVYEIKQRPASMPFIVLIPDIVWVDKLAENINSTAEKLIEIYWMQKNKEPLTLILKKKYTENSHALNGKKSDADFENKTGKIATIAARLDALAEMVEILKICGPVISTSATISGTALSPKNIKEIPLSIKEKTDIVFDYGRDLAGTASTIVDVTEKNPVLLREGSLKYDDILKSLKLNH